MAHSVLSTCYNRFEALSKNQKHNIKLVTTFSTILLAIRIIQKSSQHRPNETLRERIPYYLIRNFDVIRRTYTRYVLKDFSDMQESLKKKWEVFGSPLTALPEQGMSIPEVTQLLFAYWEKTAERLKGKQFSGTIYSNINLDESAVMTVLKKHCESLSSHCTTREKIKNLDALYALASCLASYWNGLHSDEFPITSFVKYQVIRMLATMYGGDPNKVHGIITTGGTESLGEAVRAYRNFGFKTKNLQAGQGVIIAPDSVHAGIFKACEDYEINLILIPTNERGEFDLSELEREMRKNQNKLLAIIGSAPEYPRGKINPIQEMGELAKKYKCGMHVDLCLGGFVLEGDYLQHATSVSADPHKFGLAPKGNSVVLLRSIGEWNLSFYLSYRYPHWVGGVYGSQGKPGSESALPALNAFITLITIGANGYSEIRKEITQCTQKMASIIKENFAGQIRLVLEPEVNVVTFEIDPSLGLNKGATYYLAEMMASYEEMNEKGHVLNLLQKDQVHYCITPRFTEETEGNLASFERVLKKSLEKVIEKNKELKDKGMTFPGKAGIYGKLETARNPEFNKLSVSDWFMNLVFGKIGANDAVGSYFYAEQDPFANF